MSTPRRRLIRPVPSSIRAPTERRLDQLRAKLDAERSALARWMTRLKRAFHTVENTQARIVRLERQLVRAQEGGSA